jgi:hypothetical protein
VKKAVINIVSMMGSGKKIAATVMTATAIRWGMKWRSARIYFFISVDSALPHSTTLTALTLGVLRQ